MRLFFAFFLERGAWIFWGGAQTPIQGPSKARARPKQGPSKARDGFEQGPSKALSSDPVTLLPSSFFE